ncbi:MAG TPA: hypothetical protein VGB45_13245 [Abditibacterium sp.]|jgi:hypothetical protein
MTKTLKQQLALLALAGTVVFGARQIAAQNVSPQSAAEAAQLFGRLLAAHDPKTESEGNNRDIYLRDRLISRANQDQLLAGSFDVLLRELQIAATAPQFDIAAQKEDGGTTVVEIAPAAKPKSLPVVIVRENGGFRVDLLATYAKRMKIAPEKLADTLYSKTNLILEGGSQTNTAYAQNRICVSRLKQIGLGIAQYTQDYDEVFPRAANWQENLQPYLKDAKLFRCPLAPQNGYALNAILTGKLIYHYDGTPQQVEAGPKDVSRTIAVYETSDLRADVIGNGKTLAFRHQQFENQPLGTNLLFADGRVQHRFQKSAFDFSLNPAPPKPTK